MAEKKPIIDVAWNLDNSYASLPKIFFNIIKPNPVSSPKLIIFNDSLATSLGLNAEALKGNDGIEVLAGNEVPKGALPLAQVYAGHQFGNFTMLGDGRAMLIGEQITPKGERFDIQLKGSGRTPYSRGGDGRASLGPMLREYIISEAMNGLGIDTTRSLAVVTTGETIVRETPQLGAIMTRVAAGHIRVGTFQYVSRWGTTIELKALSDYTLKRHFQGSSGEENQYRFLLSEVVKRQAALIAKWQLVGFIHGVMNTDNMAISGETIDYGPCAFMDTYDRATVFSSIDIYGRYAYGNQPNIAQWNLARFAQTLLPLLDDNQDKAIKIAEQEISNFTDLYHFNWIQGMRAKLGIFNEEIQDEELTSELLRLMEKNHWDYTNTFLSLTFDKALDTSLFGTTEFDNWYEMWQARLGRQKQTKTDCHQLMLSSNPAIIPRNHRVEAALQAAVKQGDYSVMEELLHVLKIPYAHSPEQAEYATPPGISTSPYRTYCGT